MNRPAREALRILILIAVFSLAWSCKPGQAPPVSDALITASVSAATSTGLKLAIKDVNKQHVIANYLNTYAGALRTITGNPTDAQLTAQLMAFVPPDIENQYPEIASFAIPLIVGFYDWAHAKYGNDTAQLYKILNDVATGIETGASCCLH